MISDHMLWTLFLILFVSTSDAAITGSDDRHEVIDAPTFVQEFAPSVVALIRKKNLTYLPNNKVRLTGRDFQQELGFCPDARFTNNQQLIANCSGALVKEDIILTAAHCVERGGQLNLDEFVAVFDYRLETPSQKDFIVESSAIYKLNTAVHFEFNFPGDRDIALIKLERKVEDRAPLAIDQRRVRLGEEIFMMGFPFGLAMKYTDNGFVTKETGNFSNANDTFTSDLDSFSVNSGSPVFHTETQKIVGVLVRGSGMNYEPDPERGCHQWGGMEQRRDYFSEINYIDLVTDYLK